MKLTNIQAIICAAVLGGISYPVSSFSHTIKDCVHYVNNTYQYKLEQLRYHYDRQNRRTCAHSRDPRACTKWLRYKFRREVAALKRERRNKVVWACNAYRKY